MFPLEQSVITRLKREATLFLGLFVFGLWLLPIAIYVVGQAVFGAYGSGGLFGFYGAMFRRLLNAEAATWFLVLSPYLILQTLRLTVRYFRRPRACAGGA